MTKHTKTEVGQRAFKERSPLLSARQRAAFILIDGQRTADDVLAATAGMGITLADFDHMVAAGLLSVVADTAPVSPPPAAQPQTTVPADGSDLLDAELYARAYPLATQITASLGLRGFRLNLAVEAAAGYQDLLTLLPKIRAVVGDDKCKPLERALQR